MSSIAIPLTVRQGRMERSDNINDAVTGYLNLLVGTTRYITAADPEFGFVFNNLKFENVNEKEGIVYNRKLSGSSKNLNTYAAELQQAISRYEPRLKDVKVSMTYIREEKRIYTNVNAVMAATQKPYQYSTAIKVWR